MANTTNNSPLRLLPDVSRSFYVTIRVLPSSIRRQIGLAYLLARTTDTIADTELVPLEQRLQGLQAVRDRIAGTRDAPLDFSELASQQGSPAERLLLEKCEPSLALLQSLTPTDLRFVREVLNTIISGQELDLRRFAHTSAQHIVALPADEELEDYTYRVAGCVGEFWTRICRAHLFPQARLDETALLADGVRFGKGLQLVNVLRDLPTDLRHGRCYLPEDRLSVAGLRPNDLLQPAIEPRLRPLYNTYLDRAESYLMSGWSYTNALPRRSVRVRLACAWPVLIGLKTLNLLRSANMLDPQQRIKISRHEVRQVMLRSVLFYPWRRAWNGLVSGASSSNPCSVKAIASLGILP